MRRVKIGLIILLCVITVGLCGILAYAISGANVFRGHEYRNYNNVHLVLEEEIPLAGIDCISVFNGMNSNDIYLFENREDTVIVKEYSSCEPDENELPLIKTEGNALEIQGTERIYSGFGFWGFPYGYERHYTEIWLPASYHGEIVLETVSGEIVSDLDMDLNKDFTAVSTSGDIKLPSLTADNVSVTTSSGSLITGNIITNADGSSGEIRIKTTSGDVNLEELIGNSDIGSISGELTVEMILGNAQLGTTSGDMNVREIQGETSAESSSGNIVVMLITGDSLIKTVSGDIKVQQTDGDLQAMTSSGCVQILGGSGDRIVSTASGDIVAEGTEGAFQAETQSGDVRIIFEKGEGNIQTTSGEIQLGLEKLSGDLSINSASGNVNISLPEDNGFVFAADTNSGNIKTFFDNELSFTSREDHAQGVHGSDTPENQIKIKTISGDIKISSN